MIQNKKNYHKHSSLISTYTAKALLLLAIAVTSTQCVFIRPLPAPTPIPHPAPAPPPAPVPESDPIPNPEPIAYKSPTAIPTDCPTTGTAVASRAKKENELKNRTMEPPDGYAFVPIDSLLDARQDEYEEDQGIYTEGYLYEVKLSAPESCNCNSKTDRDIHIAMVPTLNDLGNKKKIIIVEITPRLQVRLSIKDLKKLAADQTRIRVFGWLLYDGEHSGAAWRGSEWEIHPVTDVEVVGE